VILIQCYCLAAAIAESITNPRMWINLNSFPQDIVKFSQFSALRHFIHGGAGETFTFLTRMLSIEVLIALFGIMALTSVGYLGRFINGTEASAGSYALVCPGVAMSVLGHFWITKVWSPQA